MKKSSKYSKMILAAIVGTALVQAGPAAAKQNDNDDALSVYEFGPWGSMGAPAAGPWNSSPSPAPVTSFRPQQLTKQERPGVNFRAGDSNKYTASFTPTSPAPASRFLPPKPTDDDERPEVDFPPGDSDQVTDSPSPTTPPPEAPQGLCVAGSPCGWATNQRNWSTQTYDGTSGVYSYDSGEGSVALTPFEMTGMTLDTPNTNGMGSVSNTTFIISAPLNDHHDLTQIHSLNMNGNYELDWVNIDWTPGLAALGATQAHADTSGFETTYAPESSRYSTIYADVVVPPWDVDIAIGEWRDGANTFTNEGKNQALVGNRGMFVSGTSTAQVALDALKAGQVTINYVGQTLSGGSPVSASINFGTNQWDASFNGGQDNAQVWKDVNNGNLSGGVGFIASGHTSGPNLITDKLSALDGTINKSDSTLQSAVFGTKAQVLAGGYEIVKSRTDGSYTNGRNSDVFVSVETK